MTKLALDFDGSGSGPCTILLHPVGLNRSTWGGLISALAKVHKVISVDLRGFGTSAPAHRPGRMNTYVEDVIALIEEVAEGGPVNLVGLSFGGMIAQNVAIARPEMVDSLVVCGCPGTIPKSLQPALYERAEQTDSEGMESAVESTLERWFNAEFLTSDAAIATGQIIRENNTDGWAAAWEAISEHDAIPGLNGFKGRSLVIGGEKDASAGVAVVTALAEVLPNSKLCILQGAPHMMQIESEAAFTDVVVEFLIGDKGA